MKLLKFKAKQSVQAGRLEIRVDTICDTTYNMGRRYCSCQNGINL